MKTMKTINLTMRQILMASFFVLLFLGGNVSAKGSEVTVASSHENIATEPALDMEDWMLNDNYWKTPGETYLFAEENDADLEVESWMTNENYWKSETLALLETESEKELTIDNWMINDDYWK